MGRLAERVLAASLIVLCVGCGASHATTRTTGDWRRDLTTMSSELTWTLDRGLYSDDEQKMTRLCKDAQRQLPTWRATAREIPTDDFDTAHVRTAIEGAVAAFERGFGACVDGDYVRASDGVGLGSAKLSAATEWVRELDATTKRGK